MEHDAHERYEDELAAYMLGSLEPGEVDAFEAHLAGCEHCQARERWLRGSVELLPAAVEQVEPPPALRERLMETVRREAGVPQDAARPRPARRAGGLRAWLRGRSLRPATALAATLLVIAAAAAGYAVGTGTGGGPEPQTIAAEPTPAAPAAASGTLVRSGDRGVLRVTNLPQRRGRVYEVWLVQNGKPVPSALFQVGTDGSGSAGIPRGLDRSTQVMVSSEPAEGSLQPTTQPLLSART